MRRRWRDQGELQIGIEGRGMVGCVSSWAVTWWETEVEKEKQAMVWLALVLLGEEEEGFFYPFS